MKKLIAVLPFAALVLASGSAFAAQEAYGEVSSANPSTGMINLTDGSHFKVSTPVLLNGMAPGDHVIVTINDDKTVGIAPDSGWGEDNNSDGHY